MFKIACVWISNIEVAAADPPTFVGGSPFAEDGWEKGDLHARPAAAKKGNAAAIEPAIVVWAKNNKEE